MKNWMLLILRAGLCALFLCGEVSAAMSDEDFFKLCSGAGATEVSAAVSAGASLQARDEEGLTPLMLAALHNPDPKVIGVLQAAGADVNARSQYGPTALMWAASKNSRAVVVALLIAGAKATSVDENGLSALMIAAAYNSDPGVAEALLGAGAGVNDRDEDGETPLILAARKNSNPEVAGMLLRFGANPTLRDHVGKTALDYARERPEFQGTPALAQLEGPQLKKRTPSGGNSSNASAPGRSNNRPLRW